MNKLKRYCFPLLTLLLTLTAATPTLQAQSNDNTQRYITDILLVPLRTGPSMEYRIVNSGLRSGTPVTLLEQNEENQWSRVRAKDQEGWLPSRYLLNEPVAREQLTRLQDELDALRSEYTDLQTTYEELREERVSADTLYQDIETERDEALAELERVRELSSNAVALDERNKELLTQNRRLENERDRLRSVTESLQADTNQWRMIMGGALVVAGLLIGLILPALVRQRRSDGWA